jgi:tRNA (cmo5U34)-methyltransferase
MTRDRIYRSPRHPVTPFVFDKQVADVFDDMIHRSVPMYAEIIRQQARMVEPVCHTDATIYDLGCSTGNLALALCERMPAGRFNMIAVDSSAPMLTRFSRRLEKIGRTADVTLVGDDIRDVPLTRACAVVVNFTLQFIPREDRDRLVERVYEALIPGGLLLFSEKTVHPDPQIAQLQVDYYHRLKRENGYNDLEISQKREALEDVLVPETVSQHHDRLAHCGFDAIDVWLKWFNFCSWICLK